MRASAEHRDLERRLKRRLRSLPANKAIRRKMRRPPITRIKIHQFLRLIPWALAALPFPIGCLAATGFAVFLAIIHASHLASRGCDETVVNLYGADDAGIVALSRRWTAGIARWAVIDAVVFFGIWSFTGQTTLWAAALGIPLFVLGAISGPHLLATLVPEYVLRFLAGWFLPMGYLGAFLHNHLLAVNLGTLVVISGALCPAGWSVLMVRGLAAGEPLLGLLAVLIIASYVIARQMAGVRESHLIKISCQPAAFSETGPGDTPARSLVGPDAVAEAFSSARNRTLPELPAEKREPASMAVRTAWCGGILLLAAGLAHPGQFLPPSAASIVLATVICAVNLFWIPLLGTPAWFEWAFIAANRVAAMFALHPLSLRQILSAQMHRDWAISLRAIIPLAFLNGIAFFTAYPIGTSGAVTIGSLVTLGFFSKLPARWYHFAAMIQFHGTSLVARLLHGLLALAMIFTLIGEIIAILTVIHLAREQSPISVPALTAAALSGMNAAWAWLGITTSLAAYEKGRTDLVKLPPTRGSEL